MKTWENLAEGSTEERPTRPLLAAVESRQLASRS